MPSTLPDCMKRLQRVISIKKIAEHFAQRRDGPARRHVKLQERLHMKFSFRHSLPGNLDHGGGKVDAHDLIARINKFPGPNTAAATEVHDPTVINSGLTEMIQQAGAESRAN